VLKSEVPKAICEAHELIKSLWSSSIINLILSNKYVDCNNFRLPESLKKYLIVSFLLWSQFIWHLFFRIKKHWTVKDIFSCQNDDECMHCVHVCLCFDIRIQLIISSLMQTLEWSDVVISRSEAGCVFMNHLCYLVSKSHHAFSLVMF